MARAKGIKVVADNRKAHYDYIVLNKYEAGIVLSGTEVKSIRGGNVNLKDSYAKILHGEMWVIGMHISPYEQGNRYNLDPMRSRKLLLHKQEIDRLFGKIKQEGLTLVPLQLYFKNGRVKLELGLAKGKKNYDKRQSMIQRTVKRDIDRALKNSNK
ncbi:SsrA-binding protein [Mageeibacillus indolicus UPII9-5]|uniref:SsrA-binding protein n=1 Tax=Mageeibacillus indolicus (strain UPII9-5) TaxID=699246 RepID=D3R314_MAGIU|nr:SsrA-binding protein SmpB [Mageeibacillus indolicus]ADC91808.1 SsrA-binding protein [Mageeibacillus indolicus UPII9-5]